MGIGTRSKSHQGECVGQEPSSLRVTIDSSTTEKGSLKGATSGNDNNSNQTNNSTSSHISVLSVNPNVNERRLGKQSKADLQPSVEDGTGYCISVTAAASGNIGTKSSTNVSTTIGSNTSNNTSMTLVTRTRGVKRLKREQSPPGSPAKKIAKEVKTATPEAKKRQWELWTVDEKSTFFQALNECGRNFDAIKNNFAQKYKKKGAPAIMIKNKEQVRHFYYRTWHKISKYIEMKDGIKKHALEVYGLIHYGEMRKRLGGMLADKNLHKLNEFIQEGSTLIKIRRKSFRIRTPYCNALKKINNVEDPVEDDDSACRVPERVTLELNPKNNSAWLHVQEMAQNPRLRMTLKSDQHLSTVMSFLQKKWKPPHLKLKESLNSFDETQKQLVLYPHRSSKCYPVSLQAIETQPRPDLKLNNYHVNTKEASSIELLAQFNKSDQSGEIKSFLLPSTTASIPTTTNTTTITTTTTSTATSTTTTAIVASSTVTSTVSTADISAAEDFEKIKSKLLEQSKKGWTLKEAEDLTIAQLFLIFGKEELIRLEYDWSKTSPDSKEELYDCYTIINRLRRLVHLATMEFTDYVKVKAPKSNEKPKSGKSNTGCEVCEACGKILNPSDSKGNSKLVNKNSYLQSNTKNGTVYKESYGNSENASKDKKDAKADKKAEKKIDKKVDKKLDDSERVDGVFRVPVIPGRGPLSQTLVPNEYINQYRLTGYRRKLQRSARKPVFFQRTFLPKENPRMMTLALLPTATPVTVEASFLPVNNTTNAVITTRNVSSFSNTYTTQVLTQPIASTLSVHNPNNSVIVQGAVPQKAAAITVTTTTAATTTTASTTVTDSFNTVKSAVVISPSPSPSLPVETNPLSLKLSSIEATSSSPTVSELTDTPSDMITLLNVNSSSADAVPLSTAPKTGSSPPNISTLFDISLSDVPMSILEGSESKGPSTDSGLVTPPLHTEYRLQTSSYNSLFKFNSDNNWMLGEMGDISLGSLLNDSPIKKSSSSDLQTNNLTGNSSSSCSSNSSSSSISSSLTLNSLFNDWSRDSSTSRMDLDTTLQMIMNENSMDYVSKFAELAEKVAASDATVANSNAAAAAAVLAAKNGAKNNDVAAQDNVNCTNAHDCMTQLNDTFH